MLWSAAQKKRDSISVGRIPLHRPMGKLLIDNHNVAGSWRNVDHTLSEAAIGEEFSVIEQTS